MGMFSWAFYGEPEHLSYLSNGSDEFSARLSKSFKKTEGLRERPVLLLYLCEVFCANFKSS